MIAKGETPMVAALICLLASATTAAPPPDIQELVLAERQFARTSVESGMRPAFLEFLADDAVVFRPGPVPGREFFSSSPAVPGRLSWEPLWADVSRKGDLGYTTGPFQYTPEQGESFHGHYVSVWRRQSDGTWKVEADIGNSHSRPEGLPSDLRFPARPGKTANRALRADAEARGPAQLDAAMAGYAALTVEQGPKSACRTYASPDLRLHREGVLPVLGRKPACGALTERDERPAISRAGWGVADSLDLGYGYGTLELPSAEEGGPPRRASYLRIWKTDKGGAWRLVLDVQMPHPPAAAAPATDD